MALIQLPQRFLTQPQYAAPVNKAHPLAKNTTLFINGAAPNFNAATGRLLPVTAGGSGFSQRTTQFGKSLYTPDNGWADFPIDQDWKGANSVIALCRVNSIVDAWGGIFTKNASEGASQFAVGKYSVEDNLYATVDQAAGVERIIPSTFSELAKFNAVVFTHSGVAATPMSFYRNGVYVGVSYNLGTQPSGTGTLRLGGEPSSSASFDSDVDWMAFVRVGRVLSAKEIAEYASNPINIWAMLQAPPRRLYFTVSAGGTTYNQSVAGSITAAGALAKRTDKAVAGSSTAAGALSKLTSKGIDGFLTGAGGLVKQTAKTYTGSITGSGSLATMILFTASFAGSITPSGAIAKLTMKALSGASTLTGAITKKTFKALDGNISVAGVLTKLTKKAMAGSVTAAGAVTTSYQVLKSLAGSITPAGALATVYIAFVAGVLKLLALMGVGQ